MLTPEAQKAPTTSNAVPSNATAQPSARRSLRGAGYDQQAASLVPGATPAALDPQAVARDLLRQGITSENEITNEVFWRMNELLRGVKLRARSPEAMQWLALRDTIVRPAIARAHDTKKPGKRIALEKSLTDESLLAKVQLEDLVTAAQVSSGDSYQSVTMAHNHARAERLGQGGRPGAGQEPLTHAVTGTRPRHI